LAFDFLTLRRAHFFYPSERSRLAILLPIFVPSPERLENIEGAVAHLSLIDNHLRRNLLC